jgi:hypothetical protein
MYKFSIIGSSKTITQSLILLILYYQIVSINHTVSLTVPLMFALLSSSSIASVNVFAQPPDSNYNTNGTCGAYTSNGDLTKKTCCWTERIAGKLPPNNKVNYCQTCTYNTAEGTSNCDKPQQQLTASPTSPQGKINEDLATKKSSIKENLPMLPPPDLKSEDKAAEQQPSKPTPPQGSLNDNIANQLE